MACRLKTDFRLHDICIYDRQEGLGGAWWANTYPGCAVDIPGFCYSFSFAPNPDFTKLFPSQAEILDCLANVVKQYGIGDHFIGGIEWIDATWNEQTQTWLVTLRDIQNDRLFTQECQTLISAVGGLVNPQELKIPGVERFQGDIIHTARWDATVDLSNKHVAVIGNGESYWDLLIPKYEFGCKRRIFDRGYLASLWQSNMRLTDDPIVKITANSIITRSGEELFVDAILLANGFALTHYDTNLKGRKGITRQQHWNKYGHKATFKTIAMHGFPNFFYILGPNSGRLHTSTIQIIESQVEMVTNLMRPILLKQASSVEVKAISQREFDVQLHEAIDKTVHSAACGSVSFWPQ
ncbi:uncharacterized protein N7484_010850 [Penicillium longicatenatum]|uniref:uncharacterized protein n=1 Tax=Penicillium longicatenatum TaxID=1561947 RepID=UPI002547CAB1|nr:uncharacterized protein N7484_010850 [Penicillium longicatenatum]KAJ5630750.1 hypothetical protein N7484_010850 [Penicillium longicatenatum]